MPLLLVVSGPPGVGKSATADAVAALRPAVRLSIDDVEEAMLACWLPADGTGVAAYEVLRAAAEQNLLLGADVVVDAVNDSEPARETWTRAAAASSADLAFVLLELDAGEHRRRLEGRSRPFVRIVEPGWDRVVAVMAGSAPWPATTLRLDAARTPEEIARDVLARLDDGSRAGGALRG